jgi:hypothetical protein
VGFEREREGGLETRITLAIVDLVAKGAYEQWLVISEPTYRKQIYFENYNGAEHAHAWPAFDLSGTNTYNPLLSLLQVQVTVFIARQTLIKRRKWPQRFLYTWSGLKLYKSTGDAKVA